MFEEIDYSDGEYLVEMGDKADALYWIKKGEVVCHVPDGNGKKVSLVSALRLFEPPVSIYSLLFCKMQG